LGAFVIAALKEGIIDQRTADDTMAKLLTIFTANMNRDVQINKLQPIKKTSKHIQINKKSKK
jgi:hypothetical protein